MTLPEDQPPASSPEVLKDFLKAVEDPKYIVVADASKGLMRVGGLFALVTIIYVFINAWGAAPKIGLGEQLITASLAVLLAALGVLLRTAYNGMRTTLVLEALKFQGELNSQIHEEKLKKIPQQAAPEGSAGSQVGAPAVANPSPEWFIFLSNKKAP